ncbi:MAG: acyltransferase family protein [Candidatus Omnitrophota bacterium]
MNSLRAWAILLVVLGHAGIPYMATEMPGLLWAVRDASGHPFFDWLVWAAQFLAMPFFFFIAGFFSAKKLEIQGARAFIADRAKRILVPFLAAAVVILPLVYYAWSCGWYLSGRCTLREILLAKFLDPVVRANLFGPAHLWFLEYLFLVSLAYPLFGRLKLAGRVEKTLAAFPILFAIPTAVILAVNYDAGIHYQNTFLPFPFRFLHYFTYFLAGALARRFPDILKAFETKGVFFLALSAPALAATGFLLRRYVLGEINPAGRLALSGATALFTWSMLLGGIGLALRTVRRQQAAVRYLSDASFAIYLVHMPVVGFLQVMLYRFEWPAGVKFLIVFVGAFLITLFFYQTTRVPDYLTGVRPLGVFSRAQKTALTLAFIAVISAVGSTYQVLYNREKTRYREVVTGFYREHLGRKPDRIGLEHWTMMALNKWGLEKVERIGFIEAKAKGAK